VRYAHGECGRVAHGGEHVGCTGCEEEGEEAGKGRSCADVDFDVGGGGVGIGLWWFLLWRGLWLWLWLLLLVWVGFDENVGESGQYTTCVGILRIGVERALGKFYWWRW